MPPLRHHVEDVAELVPHLLARLTRSGPVVFPAAMRVLMCHRWPGNVEQLHQVLRATCGPAPQRDRGRHRPAPEYRATSRRVLTPLEAIECDAIVDALADAGGNRAEAARRLGTSRATIYRGIREYGLAPPGPD